MLLNILTLRLFDGQETINAGWKPHYSYYTTSKHTTELISVVAATSGSQATKYPEGATAIQSFDFNVKGQHPHMTRERCALRLLNIEADITQN